MENSPGFSQALLRVAKEKSYDDDEDEDEESRERHHEGRFS